MICRKRSCVGGLRVHDFQLTSKLQSASCQTGLVVPNPTGRWKCCEVFPPTHQLGQLPTHQLVLKSFSLEQAWNSIFTQVFGHESKHKRIKPRTVNQPKILRLNYHLKRWRFLGIVWSMVLCATDCLQKIKEAGRASNHEPEELACRSPWSLTHNLGCWFLTFFQQGAVYPHLAIKTSRTLVSVG